MEATSTEERVEWLTENYDLSTNNAKALILSELGYSHSGISSKLDVNKSTARSYLRNLEEQIGQGVTEALPKQTRYPTYPGDTPKGEVEYSGNSDMSPEFQERHHPLSGNNIKGIPKELITLDV